MFHKNNDDEMDEQVKPKKKGSLIRRVKFISILFVVGTVLFGGLNLQSPETDAKDITNIQQDIGNGTLIFTLVIEVDNPNIMTTKLTGVDAEAYIDGQYAGPVESDKEFTIRGMRKTDIEIDFQIDGYAGGSMIKVEGKATVRIMGSISFEKNIDKEKPIV